DALRGGEAEGLAVAQLQLRLAAAEGLIEREFHLRLDVAPAGGAAVGARLLEDLGEEGAEAAGLPAEAALSGAAEEVAEVHELGVGATVGAAAWAAEAGAIPARERVAAGAVVGLPLLR